MGRGYGSRNNSELWCRQVFRKWGISLHDISRRLSVSTPYLSCVLSGSIVPSTELEKKIEELALQVVENAKTQKNY